MAKKKLQKAFEHDTTLLPRDILFSILVRLSVQSLLRFLSVSKSWKVMISDKEFLKAYRDQSKALGRERMLMRHACTQNFMFRDLESRQVLVTMDDKQLFPNERFQGADMVCSCDGLVLLRNYTAYKNYALWNSSTKEYRLLECSCIKVREDPPNACGLCYDSRIADYKVILIYKSFYVVYSLSSGSWTRRASPPHLVLSYFTLWCDEGVSIQGCLHWSMNTRIEKYVDRNSTIIYFDVSSDELKKLPTPNLDFIGEDDLFRLTSVKGRLSVYGGKKTSRELHVWIMEQDGWNLLMNICNLPSICRCFVRDSNLLYYNTKRDQVLFQGYLYGLSIYYPQRKQFVTDTRDKRTQHVSSSIYLDTLYFWSPTQKRRKRRLL